MKVLVDTSVWSTILRRKIHVDSAISVGLRELITELRAQMIGPIRQELLSGIRKQSHFETLRDHLHAFADFEIVNQDYERAAEFFNICQVHGVQGSNTDFLICAVAERHNVSIFTTDNDFDYFTHHLPVTLYLPGSREQSPKHNSV